MTANTPPRTFIDIHVLQTVPPSCINRDDNGSPKTAVYGGVTRHRVSSQAWKRATRREFNSHLDVHELGERTLYAVDRIAARIREQDPEIDAATAVSLATDALTAAGVKTKQAKPAKKADGEAEQEPGHQVSGYLVFLSRAQIDALAALAVRSHISGDNIVKQEAKRAFTDEHSIDVALFGRMIAEAPETNVDAACQVSHAISVHAASPEFDYFTAVDDNAHADNAGAGMIGTVEFVSSTLYRYATIDAAQLVENLGSAEAALRAVQAFLSAFVMSMPTGKQNTFAHRTRPGVVLVEIRSDQPVNLAAAFERPIATQQGCLPAAAKRLVEQAIAEDAAFGTTPVKSGILVADPEAAAEITPILERADRVSLTELISLVADTLRDRAEAAV